MCGGVIRQIRKEGLVRVGALPNMFDGPIGKEIGRVAFGIDLRLVHLHIVNIVAQMGIIVVHHIAEKPFKTVETALRRMVFGGESQMPFAK